ncbi:alpha-(1,3)-fucosyltransferase C [Harpegnathos saltator]|uniref:alpha-(1,3)-fucosyltransferase C n=1 Tax=Harpegnathos saltator TaxID=610380 RepID=UPI000DBEDCF7|nr:alpha-(1,3)-fucosyltransferase C [Harpegnathos saltator]XP_011145102.2 alpha-(1,3)-fucosyltransferase C [Harpegnathos saltator]XP_011145104.2 alpha-(1,3)-fucosyltransferase C [Harpegnathos saltator]XP_025160285.1 alpha-(1,3)-fucosyltransferase C [Harpegnathos saltator]XP_025160286.1 alpha-(1,3)-fucosyltransferase C [Harpegnathos saltator]XP_025160287.1 alpha-(1,3)-fucosyltransferase C [Harpegnathos saltator]
MHKKLYLFIGLIALSIVMFCLYLSRFYDAEIPNTYSKTFMIHKNDPAANVSKPEFADEKYMRAWELSRAGIKTILLWNTLFGNRNFYFGEGDVFRGCPVDRCEVFNDHAHLNVEDYDAVLFHGNELYVRDVPQKRRTRQLYVYVNLESPANRKIPDKYYENYFNLTMTYRLDSDILWSYGTIEDVATGDLVAPFVDPDWAAYQNEEAADEEAGILDVVKGKSKPVTWFVSNCQAKSGRLEYVKELSKHIGVDVYGECGERSCLKTRDCFRDVVEPNYFFYLSFENSFCDDYVTEKLMNPLRYNVVPVVYGGANYSRFAPPNSYVNALDFESPKELAAYLKYLSQDLRRYQSFLQWKKYYRVGQGTTKRTVCALCDELHQRKSPKTYPALSHWYAKDKCPIQKLLQNTNDVYATKLTLTSRVG